jgi:hypothetical protein
MRKKCLGWLWGIGMALLLLFAGCTMLISTPPAAAPADENKPLAEAAEYGGAKGVTLRSPEPPPFETNGWRTDFTKRIVEWGEIRSGGPPKDGIPSIDEPSFESVAAASHWLSERDPVILFEHNGEVRAYPLAILIWHEIVNDVVGGKPVTITFCPLCNASIVFDRTFQGQVLNFGTTGRLRNSDLVMYDRQTESWWQQFTGEGLVGQFAGEQLTFLGGQVISFGDFAAEFPDGQVLQRLGTSRSYGINPYTNYDSTEGRPFLYDGELDTRLPSTERVIGVEIDENFMAYPFSKLAEIGVINDELGGKAIVILHKAGTASALDQQVIREGRDVGSIAVFDRELDGRTFTFNANTDGTFTDTETGSTWNILGEAIAGELKGQQLKRVLSFDHFWFAWSAFYPETRIYE